MKCPLCSTATQDGATECPSCGAIFAKLREREEREKKKAADELAKAEAPPAPAAPLNPWTLRLAAAGFVVLWMIGFALYYRIQLNKLPDEPKPFAPREELTRARLRDPVTGELKDVEVRKAIPYSPPPQRGAPPRPAGREEPRPEGIPHDPDFDD